MKKPIIEELDRYLEEESLESVLETRFGRYSKYVIQERALPDIRDGLKPVQRRILYAMWMLKLKANSSYKKSARVVGDVIGKYHPHGDSSVYSAMIRLGQDWKATIPLVDIHGNKGSIDGDPPAAMRYTEARLSSITHFFLEDIAFNTVPFILNFDDSELEPVILPSYVPNFIINGAKGIASGYATDVPPHNLGEVIEATKEMILNPNLSVIDLMKIIKGPDFPTYGTIYGIEDIFKTYKTGQGRILIRATINEEKDNNKKILHIKDIPFDTNKMEIIKKIEEFIINKEVSGLKSVRDDSDRNGVSIVIELDSLVNKTDSIVKYLYKYTKLQTYYNVNLVGIADNRPRLLTLPEIINYHIVYIKEIATKKAAFLLGKSKKRLEIIHGLIKAISILDAIIKTIRKSRNKADAIINLVKKFKFTKNQATAIVNLRLHRLTSTDILVLKSDQQEQMALIKHYSKLLKSKTYLNNHLINILDEIKLKYATKRKTKIIYDLPDVAINLKEIMSVEQVGVIVSKDGYVKRLTFDNYNEHIKDTPYIRGGDAVIASTICTTKDTLLLITSKGNFLTIPIYRLGINRWQSDGEHVNSLSHIASNEKIVSTILISSFDTVGKTKVIMLSKHGMIKATYLSAFQTSRISKSIMCMKIRESDELVSATLSANDRDDYFMVTEKQKGMKIKISTIPTLGLRTTGVKGIKLKNDSIIYSSSNDNDIIFIYNTLQYFYIDTNAFKRKKRAQAPERLHSKNIKHLFIGACQPSIASHITFTDNDLSSEILVPSIFSIKKSKKQQLIKLKFQLPFEWVKVYSSSIEKPDKFRITSKVEKASKDSKKTSNTINEDLRLALKAPFKNSKKRVAKKYKNQALQSDIKTINNYSAKEVRLEKKIGDSLKTKTSFHSTTKKSVATNSHTTKKAEEHSKIVKKDNMKPEKDEIIASKKSKKTKSINDSKDIKKAVVSSAKEVKGVFSNRKDKSKKLATKRKISKKTKTDQFPKIKNDSPSSSHLETNYKSKLFENKTHKTGADSQNDSENSTKLAPTIENKEKIQKNKKSITEEEEDYTVIDFKIKEIIGDDDNEE